MAGEDKKWVKRREQKVKKREAQEKYRQKSQQEMEELSASAAVFSSDNSSSESTTEEAEQSDCDRKRKRPLVKTCSRSTKLVLTRDVTAALDRTKVTKAREKFWRKGSVDVSRDCPNCLGTPYYLSNGKSYGFQIWPVYIHRVQPNKSTFKILENVGKSSRGCSQGLPKIFRAPIHIAHRVVIFAIAQLSCWRFI